MPHRNRFTFVETRPDTSQRLVLAELSYLSDRSTMWRKRLVGSTISTLASVPSATNFAAIQHYAALKTAPSNRFVAAYAFEQGGDFRDYNITVFDLASGDRKLFVNEHSFNGINRTTCPSPVFQNYLDESRAIGATQMELDTLDYSIDAQVTYDSWLGWKSNDTLAVGFDMDVNVDGQFIGNQFFYRTYHADSTGAWIGGAYSSDKPSLARLGLPTIKAGPRTNSSSTGVVYVLDVDLITKSRRRHWSFLP